MSILFDIVRNPLGCNMQVGDIVDLSPLSDNGILKHLIEKGKVDEDYPSYGDTIAFNYFAYIGTELFAENMYDSSERDGCPFEYDCLKGRVVRGFELAVLTMKPMERAVIYIQPQYAFGNEGSPPSVPQDSPIIFDTQIVSIKCPDLSIEQDRSILKKVLNRGKDYVYPNQGATLDIHIKGEWTTHMDGRWQHHMFMNKDIQFTLGEGTSRKYDVPKCLEIYLDQWLEGEITRLTLKAKHAYGPTGSSVFNIPPNSDVRFCVHMKSFTKVKDLWQMGWSEKFDRYELWKTKGDTYYKSCEYELAERFYELALEFALYDVCMQDMEEKEHCDTTAERYEKLAQAQLKQKKYEQTKESCEQVIKTGIEGIQNVFYMRGLAQFHMKMYAEAKEDFQTVISSDVYSLSDASNYIDKCNTFLIAIQHDQ